MMRYKFGGLVSVLLLISACTSAPDSSQCGSVSGFIDADRGQGYYRAIVTHIQGKPVASLPNYQLEPGEYQFRFAELIHDPKLQVDLSARQTKVLNIKVEAGQRYHFAAKFNDDRVYYGQESDYWHPVIWLQDEHECVITTKKDNNKQ